MIDLEATGARWPSRSSKPAAAPLRGRLGSTPRRFRQSHGGSKHGGSQHRGSQHRGSQHGGSRHGGSRHGGSRHERSTRNVRSTCVRLFDLTGPAPGGASDAGPKGRGRSGSRKQRAKKNARRRYSIKRMSPARGPFCDSSGVNSTRCPSRSSSNTVPRTELRWKKCSRPDSSRMNPNPLSIRSRAIVPVGIPVSSDSESLRTFRNCRTRRYRWYQTMRPGRWPAPGSEGTEIGRKCSREKRQVKYTPPSSGMFTHPHKKAFRCMDQKSHTR